MVDHMLIDADLGPVTSTSHPRSDARPPAVERLTDRPVLALVPVLVIVGMKVAINVAFASRYGWHRDELYYADAGRHLSFGYVDFPPITPWLARLGSLLFGQSLAGLRFIAVLAGAGVVMLTALITRDLGGRRWAQVLAALAITPLTLGSNAMFQTVSFDQLAWAFVLWAAVRVLREGGTGWWLVFGVAVGAAWMTKFTVAMLVVGLVFGFGATRSGRSRLHGRGPWLATLVALGIAAPNVWWQIRHGWPSVDFFTSRSDGTRADNPPTKFVMELVLGTGVAALPVWVSGVRRLLSDRRLRPIGIAVLTVLLGWIALGGKAYYAAPAFIVAFAAGAVHLEKRLERSSAGSNSRRSDLRRRRMLPAVIIVTTVLASPLILPVVATPQMVSLGLWHARDDYAEEVGWPELVDTVSDAWHAQPSTRRAHTAIVAGNYGEAGAIDRWGPALGLPPVVSGHLSHRYWTPSARVMADTEAILVGFDSHDAHELCRTADVVAHITNRAGVDNEEAGGAVWRCVVRGSVGTRWSWLAST